MVGNDVPISTHESNIVTSKFTGKSKAVRKNRVLKVNQYIKQHKVIIVGDSHIRNCTTEVSQWLNNHFEVMGFVNPGSGMKYIGHIQGKFTEVIKERCVCAMGGLQLHSKKQLNRGYETSIGISGECVSHQRNCDECTVQA